MILVTSTTSLTQTKANDGTDKDVEAIKKVIMDGADAWNRMDMKAYAERFAPDVDFVTIRGVWLKGKEETVKGHERILGTVIKGSYVKSVDIQVRFLRPDIAIAHNVSEMTPREASGSEKPARAQMTHVLVKGKDGRWLITAFQNTEIRGPIAVPDRE